eukprot:6153237-Amphidinium_carterae.1
MAPSWARDLTFPPGAVACFALSRLPTSIQASGTWEIRLMDALVPEDHICVLKDWGPVEATDSVRTALCIGQSAAIEVKSPHAWKAILIEHAASKVAPPPAAQHSSECS